MKKYFGILFSAMLVFMAGTFFASCGGDDDPVDIQTDTDVDVDITVSSYDKMIVGDWIVYYDDDGLCKVEVTFTSKGQYIAKDYYMQGNGTWSFPSEYSGTYNVYGKTVNMVDKSDKFSFAGRLDIINMTDKNFTLKSEEYDITFRGEKTTLSTVSPIVGSWRCDYGAGGYQIMTFNNDGTGSIEDYELGTKTVDKIHYVFNESSMLLTIKYDEDGDTEKFKIKSISSTAIIINDGREDDVFYKV